MAKRHAQTGPVPASVKRRLRRARLLADDLTREVLRIDGRYAGASAMAIAIVRELAAIQSAIARRK